MLSHVSLISLLVGMGLTMNLLRADDDVGNANDYVDEVLQNLRQEQSMVSKLDPLTIPEVSEKKFELKEGVVYGLSSLYRSGDCTLEYDGKTITLKGEVAVRDVEAYARYRAKAVFFWIKGRVVARLEHLSLRLQLSATDGKVRLESFKVARLGDYKIKKITGMSVVFNWLLKLIANRVVKKSRGKIIAALEGAGADALKKALAKVNFQMRHI